MSSSSNHRLSYYTSLSNVPTSSPSPSSRSTSNLVSSSTTTTSSASIPSSSRRIHHSHSHSRPPQSLNSSRERKVHAKKLLKKYPVISPESFGRVSKFCPVCLDLLTSATITKTACNHLVHRSCLLKRLTDDPTAACPSCRVPVKPPRKPKNGGSNDKSDKGSKLVSLQLGPGGGVGAPLAGMGPIETIN